MYPHVKQTLFSLINKCWILHIEGKVEGMERLRGMEVTFEQSMLKERKVRMKVFVQTTVVEVQEGRFWYCLFERIIWRPTAIKRHSNHSFTHPCIQKSVNHFTFYSDRFLSVSKSSVHKNIRWLFARQNYTKKSRVSVLYISNYSNCHSFDRMFNLVIERMLKSWNLKVLFLERWKVRNEFYLQVLCLIQDSYLRSFNLLKQKLITKNIHVSEK